MESQAVFQAKTKVHNFSIELCPWRGGMLGRQGGGGRGRPLCVPVGHQALQAEGLLLKEGAEKFKSNDFDPVRSDKLNLSSTKYRVAHLLTNLGWILICFRVAIQETSHPVQFCTSCIFIKKCSICPIDSAQAVGTLAECLGKVMEFHPNQS